MGITANETIASAYAALCRLGPGFILLYGEAGTGKTELSKSLSRTSGLSPYFINGDKNNGIRPLTTLLLSARLIDPVSEVLIVDEADLLINSAEPNGPKAGPSSFKSQMNLFLDDARCKIIFITNQINGIPPSFLRRMHVLIGFKSLTVHQRLKIWDRMDKKQPLFSDQERSALSYSYKANPSRIRQVYDLCTYLHCLDKPQELVYGVAKDMLSRSGELLSGDHERIRDNAEAIDINLLNPSLRADKILSCLYNWQQSFAKDKGGINLLFYGQPGTGKSVFARHIAKELMLPFINRKASDILSPYVGMTEQLIKRAFEEVEDGVLILDEVDSFIQDRKKSRNSWEITQINEFLTQMEEFRGVFIATTNFQAAMDTASFRRFSYKIEFRPSTPEQRVSLAQHFFPALNWDECDSDSLTEMDGLTPGDFQTVARRLAYADHPDTLMVLAELRSENDSWKPQNQHIGFRI